MNDLIPLYRDMAAGGAQFLGLSVLQHKEQIGKLFKRHDVHTLLDFGCGAGNAYKTANKVHHEWRLRRIDVTLYDPAFPQHDKLPTPGRKFDAVICSDVLEHVPEEETLAFIEGLFSRAKRLVWASVCCRPARKSFPDGRNLHVTIRPWQWWDDTFNEVARRHPDVTYALVETP
jgi:hypothetical protein